MRRTTSESCSAPTLSRVIICACLTALQAAARMTPHDGTHDLIGWLGDTYNAGDAVGDSGSDIAAPAAVQVSEKPRAFVYHDFLSDDEVNHILEVAAPTMRRSSVVGKRGSGVIDDIRTSYGTFISRMHDPVITRIEQRIADWTNTSLVQQEDIQVLRYVDGQKYGAHEDGLGRLATVLMFLADTDDGGETIFPDGEWLDPSLAASFQDVSPCAAGHVGLKPRRGTALLFYDKRPDGRNDHYSMHTACPVRSGMKWSAPVWIHPEPFRPEQLAKPSAKRKAPGNPLPDPGMCRDTHAKCGAWSDAGECAENPAFMVGDQAALGACRKACGACEPCSSRSHSCWGRNRERAGYLNLEDEIRQLKEQAARSAFSV